MKKYLSSACKNRTDIVKYKGKEFGASKAAEFSAEMRRWKWKVFENTPKMGPEADVYKRQPLYRDGVLYREERYVTDAITDDAVEFLNSHKEAEKPFYLHVAYTAPHAPWLNNCLLYTSRCV